MYKNKHAAKSFHRVYTQITKGFNEQCEATLSVDAGEWSAPFVQDAANNYEKYALRVVARAFNITTDEVWYAVQDLEYWEEKRCFDAGWGQN